MIKARATSLLSLTLLVACGGGGGSGSGGGNSSSGNPATADPGGIYGGTLNNAATRAADQLFGIADEMGNAVFIDKTSPTIYRTTIHAEGGQYSSPFRAYAVGGSNFPGGAAVATGTLSGTVTTHGGITGSDAISSGSVNTFNASYLAAQYQIPASFATIAGNYEYNTSGASGIESARFSVTSGGTICGRNSLGCSISGAMTIPNPSYNAYDISAGLNCGGTITQVTGLATYTPPAAPASANLTFEFDDGQNFAVTAIAVETNLPQATLVIGQPDYVSNAANHNGISASVVDGPQGSPASNGTLLYIPDTLNNRILGYSTLPTGAAAGAAQFVIGQSSFTANAPGAGPSIGSAIGLASPARVSVSDTGTQLVVADSGNNRVLIWNSLPTANSIAPNVVVGQPDLGSNSPNQGGTPSAKTLSNPTGAMIANGHLVVVDKGNNRVLIWNTVPTASDAPADVELGQAATSTTQGNCTSNAGYCFTTNTPNVDTFSAITNQYTLAMNQPSDVWTDGRRLAVSDITNNRVLYWGVFPNTQNQLPTNLFGQQQFGQGFGSPGSDAQKFNAPTGVTSDGTSLYVADTGNNRVLQFSLTALVSNGPNAIAVFGQQDFIQITANDPDQNNLTGDQRSNPATNGVTAGTLSGPTGVYAAPGGANLYVTDNSNNRILQFPVSSGVNGTQTNLCQ
ncbi:MAG: hypothetical protein P4L83_09910 [Nevskia sp.]|nr:hypothetical protein [Nevskia sp.]